MKAKRLWSLWRALLFLLLPCVPRPRVRNWVVTGALLHNPGQPAHCLPVAGRLYDRASQLPEAGGGPPVQFRTKNELMVELARAHARAVPGPHLLVTDGAFANRNTIRPLARPEG